ncbi:MAG: S8 family serine peptidase [Planctomycetes bacterium]|nr:S8 family serine peptidase [Planctomycetota bacterium]
MRVSNTSGDPVPNALVLAFNDWFPTPFEGRTDKDGIASIRVIGMKFHVIVIPYANYWDFNHGIVDLRQSRKRVEVTVRSLKAPGTFDWGHYAMDTHLVASQFQGDGIKVGIIDTGVQSDHEDLSTTGGANLVDGEPEDSWQDDPQQHGSHCSGIACALANVAGITGHAPSTELWGYKVFPAEGGGAASPDIADAIDQAIEDNIEVINLSLGSKYEDGESQVITQAIQRAFDAGIVCCIAGGNDDGLVGWPAAAKIKNIVSVAAIGKFGTYPDDSLHKIAETDVISQEGQYFRAAFSNYGDEDGDPKVDVCAPGVACISTVKDGYAAFKGTSMASPNVTGTVALLLQAHPEIRETKDQQTAVRAVEILKASCRGLGMREIYQGQGMPSDFLATRPTP